MITVSQR